MAETGILELLKGCHAGRLKEDLSDRGVRFSVLKEKQKRLYLKIEYGGEFFHVKVHNFVKEPRLKKFIGNIFYPSQAMRSWVNGRRFLELGLATPRPLGYLENRKVGVLLSTILVTEFLTGARTLKEAHAQLSETREKKEFIEGLARFVAALHNKGVVHGDLKASNILFRKDDMRRLHFYITDLASMKFKKRLSAKDISEDIACLNTSFGGELSTKERFRFLHHYHKELNAPPADVRWILAGIERHSSERLEKIRKNNGRRHFTNH